MRSGYVYIGNNVFDTLLAISSQEQSQGLMYEAWPPPVMSFIYSKPQINKFWMKNTPSPLDIIFCSGGEITQIHKGVPNSTQIIGDNSLTDLIIEVPHGVVNSSNIKLHHKVGLVKPSKEEINKLLLNKIH